MKGIIGYTGFVGSNLIEKMEFDRMFNSKNIENVLDDDYELLVCSGISARKWYANQYPEKDLENINNLIGYLKNVKCEKLILISTIDTCLEVLEPYGSNRLHAEVELQKIFKNKLSIVRLPSIFGKNLKKNVLFDLINNKLYQPINLCDSHQWYYLGNLGDDLTYVLNEGISEINLFSEPIMIKEIVYQFFNVSPHNLYSDSDSAIKYDFNTNIHSMKYWNTKEDIIKKLKKYINGEG